MFGTPLFDNLHRVVLRLIVDDDQFDGAVCLVPDGIQSRTHHVRAVIAVDNNGNQHGNVFQSFSNIRTRSAGVSDR